MTPSDPSGHGGTRRFDLPENERYDPDEAPQTRLSHRGASFLGARTEANPAAVHTRFAFVGVPNGVPYSRRDVYSPCADAPAAVRAASMLYAPEADHYDFDIGGPLCAAGRPSIADVGDVCGRPLDVVGTVAAATSVVRALIQAGASPIVIGGDHSVTPLALAGCEIRSPVDVVQVDAHLDYRDDVDGVTAGYSSVIRRARDMPWVRSVYQIGLRGSGSARPADVEDAVAAGNVLMRAEEVHKRSMQWALDQLHSDGNYYLTVDLDGLDPSCAPGVAWPVPGGLSYYQTVELIRGLSEKGHIVGMDFCEYVPARDVNCITADLITRLILIAMAAAEKSPDHIEPSDSHE